MPARIQLRRTKGWRLREISPHAVIVARPSKWGNPFAVGDAITKEDALWPYVIRTLPQASTDLPWSRITILQPQTAVDAYAYWLPEQPHLMCSLAELRGHDLACWCPPDQPCHSGVLLELANQGGRCGHP